MKSKSATTKWNARSRRAWFTAAALLPLLAGCSTDSLSSLWFDSSPEAQSIAAPNTASPDASTSMTDRANLGRAACGLFFGQDGMAANAVSMSSVNGTNEISLERSPQENLLQAISYDMNGQYENARKLYVWLTATPPDIKIDLDCGQGIKLSGNINGLAQRRLVSLDTNTPEYARSTEIEAVVAAATVEPGPELPDPPQVERDRRFYETGGVVEAEPEDSINPVTRMDMPVSDNTARLTRVERRTPARQTPATAQRMTATTPAQQTAPSVVTPVTAKTSSDAPSATTAPNTTQTPAPRPTQAAPVAVTVTPPTISGEVVSAEHSGAIIETTSRPVGQGQLEFNDGPVETSMIELPIASNADTQPTRPAQETSANAPAPAPAPALATSTAPAQQQTQSGPYYAVQLAAYRSRGRAEGAWPKFQASSNGILTNASHEVVSIAIEGKGLFFRLLTGQHPSNSAAVQACNRLKSVGVDCLIRRVNP